MRIKYLEICEDPKLGNLKLDFTKNNIIQDTIILAGNNGCGKTTILDNIFYLMNINYVLNSERNSGTIKSYIVLENDEIEIIKNNIISSYSENFQNSNIIDSLEGTNEFEYEVDFSKQRHSYERIELWAIKNGRKNKLNSGIIFHTGKMKEIVSTFYSTANIDYSLNKVNSITSNELDISINNIKTESNIGTDVKQTFVDIYNLDAQDFQKWASKHIKEKIDESKMYTRIKRFTNAFNYIFPNLKFDAIINKNEQKEVIFKNNKGNEIKIDDLSTGEKQIIIRGGYMLKYQKSIQNNLILIDEPELSLHPEWQKKILQFYKRLFTDEKGNQTSQIFVATHSPFIIHNSSRYNDKVIVLNKDDDDNITILEKPIYYSYSNNAVVEDAFDVKEFSNEKNILFTEGETDKKYIDKAIEIYFNNKVNFEVNWIGDYNKNGNAINTGYTGLNNLHKVLEANPKLLNSKIGLLYDNDTNKNPENNDNYFIYTLLLNANNSIYKIGIENQLILGDGFDYEKFIKKSIKIDEYGAESILSSLDKIKLCDYICADKDAKDILFNLKKVIEDLEKLF